MPDLTIKPHYKAIKTYYKEINKQTKQLSLIHEGNVAPHFANLLRYSAGQVGWNLAEQYQIDRKGRRPIRVDGALLDRFKLRHGIWEAKDSDDDLHKEMKKKFDQGYPQDNILFQSPNHAILVQDGRTIFDEPITDSERLVEVLKLFFAYEPPEYEQWDRAVEEFSDRVPELARSLLELIREEKKANKAFVNAFNDFMDLAREAINPNLSENAVEEMLIQHLLTERIFRTVFNNPDFARRNIIAHEIEKVITALTSRHFSRHDFLRQLDRFYGALETTAATIDDFSEKQDFLNTVYENFFQGFSVKVADTHGIVYTPQPIVEFMVRSVDDILKREFGKEEGLASDGVAILDPFVGTGNFILRVMRQMPKSKLPHKYKEELFCNEVMLLPYYIASMNIEHEYYELTGRYEPFEGISLVDTFELAEGRQMPLFVKENTKRVQRQKNTPIFVIIGNPPYNMGQLHVNDNNKNRTYKVMDERVSETYSRDSNATNKNALSDVYVKAIRWATDRIQRNEEGIVAFVTNNGFVKGKSFDGMRKHLTQDFSEILHINLKGNARTTAEQRKKEGGNVFDDQIRVSVGITFLILKKGHDGEVMMEIASVDDYLNSREKKEFLETAADYRGLNYESVSLDNKNRWITDDFPSEYDDFVPLGNKGTKAGDAVTAIFKIYGRGAETGRDAWAYNFDKDALIKNMKKIINVYNDQIAKISMLPKGTDINELISNDPTEISWSRNLRRDLKRKRKAIFANEKVKTAIYRPYTKKHLFMDRVMNQEPGQMPYFFPTPEQEEENIIICCTNHSQTPFSVQATKYIPDVAIGGRPGQTFPFYSYNKNGRNRRENITDWALEQYRQTYNDPAITKWDIFHYIYALLHHPDYRETYAANLRRELPRIPFVENFPAFVAAGERLADIHVHYEDQPEYPLKPEENPDLPLDYRVEKMRLSRDKTSLKYNDFLTLHGIPPQIFDYKLGNRSALDWVIDQYRLKTDKRSGITNDPNNLDDETYILRLIKQVISVSLETVEIVNNLPPLEIIETL